VRVAVVTGSSRPGGTGAVVCDWLVGALAAHGGWEVDVVDVAALPLDARAGAAPDPALAARIGPAEALVLLTPEYHHGYTGELKLVLDGAGPEWHGKAAGFVSYGGRSGGLIAVEQLRTVLAELHVATARDPVSFHGGRACFDAAGAPVDAAGAEAALDRMLGQLGWWAAALAAGRAARPFPS
jgi:NAD(P)H-dependent FMN reductase